MSIYTVDDTGQIFITPSVLDEFEYYRDNLFVRNYEEFLSLNPYEYSILISPDTKIIPVDYSMNYETCVAKDSSDDYHIVIEPSTGTDDYWTDSTGDWAKTDMSWSQNFSKLVVDSDDKLHLVFKNASSSYLYYASKASGSSWSSATSLVYTTASLNDSIDLWCDTVNDTLHLAICNTSGDISHHYKTTSGSWTADDPGVSSMGGAGYVSVCARNNKVWILYGRPSNYAIKVVEKDGTWDGGTTLYTDWYYNPHIFVDSSNNLYATWIRDSIKTIRIYADSGSGWALDGTIDLSDYDSIQGMAAHLKTNGSLKFAVRVEKAGTNNDTLLLIDYTSSVATIKEFDSETLEFERPMANRKVTATSIFNVKNDQLTNDRMELILL